MTEVDWHDCTNPTAMLELLRDRANERQLRLLCAACCRRVWHLLESNSLQQAVDALERFADDGIDETAFRAISAGTHPLRAYFDELFSSPVRSEKWLPAYGINRVMFGALVKRREKLLPSLRPSIEDVGYALDFFARAIAAAGNNSSGGEGHGGPSEEECAAQADLIRELFGNPFRAAPAIDPAWLAWNDGTVHRLGVTIYEERSLPLGTLDGAQLAILADAMEEAGCDNQEILAHCRQQGQVHVRGCWVIDLLLGRS